MVFTFSNLYFSLFEHKIRKTSYSNHQIQTKSSNEWNMHTVLGLSATYKEKELFRLQKQTSNDRSTHFIHLIVEKSI